MKKILIIKLRAIGDVVLSTIVLRNLRAAYPDATIDFLTEKFCAGIVKNHPLLNNVIAFDKKYAFLDDDVNCFKSLTFLNNMRKQNYDLVFDFFGNPRSALITFFSNARHRVGYDFRMRKWTYNHTIVSRADQIHEAEWHLDALKEMNIPIVSKNLSVAVTERDHRFADDFWQRYQAGQKKVIALNFSGGWPSKRWPLNRFMVLARRLVEKHACEILIVWGPGEKKEAQLLQDQISVGTTILPETNLKELAAILSRADLMITTDSGPMHIAAAMQTPCVALFGPTNPHLQGPYGKNHKIIVARGLPCLRCNRLTCDHNSCMKLISVDDVLNAATSVLMSDKREQDTE
ncbi:lipopolysaccharide heptosyltransferase II [candidate division KSB1 bacterium]|nr:lipopolysaccharide heptosyltransferase II [candidate division KSB1 bacterium]